MNRTSTLRNLLAIAALAIAATFASVLAPTVSVQVADTGQYEVSMSLGQQAEAASIIYDSYFQDIFEGNIAINTDTFNCMLVDNTYVPDKGAHDKQNDITGEVTGTGYTPGGTTCTVSGVLDTVNHRYDVTIAGPSFANSSISANGMVVYKNRGGVSSANELVSFIDFLTTVTSTGSTFSVTVSSPLRITN